MNERLIKELILQGTFYSFKLGKSSIDEIIHVMDEPEETNKFDHEVDYHWDNLCLSVDKDTCLLKRVKIEFSEDVSYSLTNARAGEMDLGQKTTLEDILLYLNHDNIPYKIVNPEIDLDYVFIRLDNNVTLTYFLPWKHLIDIKLEKHDE
jgi:hypothetical protein